MKKRGLSPVVATVLLVSLALVLAVIIFLWARAFIPDAIEKEGRNIASSCEEVQFLVDALSFEKEVHIENTGYIPLWGVEIREKGFLGGEIKKVEEFGRSVKSGQTETIDNVEGLEAGSTIIVVPVLLGETSGGRQAYVCDEDYGVESVVQS